MEKRIISKQGFLLGKFLPLHAGHIHLINTARSMTEKLWVLVCSIKREPIPGELRYHWVKQLFPDVEVVHVAEEVPQSPEEDSNFWPIWLDIFKRYGPPEPDTVFTSEDYGEEIAQRMNIRHVLVDKERKTFPVSGTQIRNDPFRYWEYIPENARPYFVKKIVLTGPESTGKTVLAQKLAEYYKTNWVEEYGREYWINLNGRRLQYDDITQIALGQIEKENESCVTANKILICDTDLIVTQVWSEIYFQKCPEWILNENAARKYDLHLLLDIYVPWVDDGTREFPHLRAHHFTRLQDELENRQMRFEIISGSYEERFEESVKVINRFLNIQV